MINLPIKEASRLAEVCADVSTGSSDIAIVLDENGRWRMYNKTAWECPVESGILPWSPPPYPESSIVAIVQADGVWHKGPAFRSEYHIG